MRATLQVSFEVGTVYAEVNLIKSVLSNLVYNACKASSPGGVVKVSGRIVEGGYEFRVQDYGVGIPEEELQRVTGLGLALCVEILRLHESELWIDSIVDEGTCMSFVLQDKPEKPERPEKSEKSERSEKSEKPEKSAKSEKPEREADNEV